MRGTCWLVLMLTVLWAGGVRVAQGDLPVWTPIGPGGVSISALAIDPATPTTLYAGTYSTGVFKSPDGGVTWHTAFVGLTDLTVRTLVLDPVTPTTLYAGTYSAGVFKSTDGAGSWQAASTGLPYLAVSTLAVDPATPTTLYAGIYNEVFKSTDGGATWQAASPVLPSHYSVVALAVDPTTPTTLYAGTSCIRFCSAPSIVKSTDAGGSWHAAGSPSPFVQDLVIDPVTPTTLYAGTYNGVFKSTDGAGSWYAASAGMTDLGVRALAERRPSSITALHGGGFTRGSVTAARARLEELACPTSSSAVCAHLSARVLTAPKRPMLADVEGDAGVLPIRSYGWAFGVRRLR